MHAKYVANPCPEHLFRDQITFLFVYFATITLGLSALRATTVGPFKSYHLNQSSAAKEELSKKQMLGFAAYPIVQLLLGGKNVIGEYIDVFVFIYCCICYCYAYL